MQQAGQGAGRGNAERRASEGRAGQRRAGVNGLGFGLSAAHPRRWAAKALSFGLGFRIQGSFRV